MNFEASLGYMRPYLKKKKKRKKKKTINQLPASFKFSFMIIWAAQELKSKSDLHRKAQPHSLGNP